MKDNLKWIIIFAVPFTVSATVWIVMNNSCGEHKNAVIRQNGKIIKEIEDEAQETNQNIKEQKNR